MDVAESETVAELEAARDAAGQDRKHWQRVQIL